MGIVLGADAAGLCLALATIFFSGALAPGLGLATGIFLLGSVAATLVLNRYGGLRLPLAISQDTTISILAPAVIAAALAVNGPPEAKVATALAVIGASAVATGLAFWGVGHLGLGRIVRMFPYPVAAGFLASSGYLLVFAALYILTGQAEFAAIARAAGDPLVQARVLPALLMALALVAAMRIWPGSSTAVLATVFVFLAGFYVTMFALGLDRAAAVDLGLLPRVDAAGAGGLSLSMLGMIEWQSLLGAAPVILAVVLLNLIGMLLNTSGVELATRADVDENRELVVTGKTNVLIGLFGCLTSYLQGGATILADKLNLSPRAMIIGHVSTLLLACALAPLMVAVIPSFVPAALLMFIGLAMLEDWLIGTWHRLKRLDWLIVLGIVLATAFIGILPAICIGIGMALVGFAYALIRLPVIRQSATAAERRSIRDRSPLEAETLLREGHRIRILHLQGSLFFGSIEQITRHLRRMAQSQPGIRAVLVDFTGVYSLDSSACAALEKLAHMMDSQGIAIHVTGLAPDYLALFEKWGLPVVRGDAERDGPFLRMWPGFDEALEHCESAMLRSLGHGPVREDIAKTLYELGRRHPRSADLLAAMERRELQPGEVLIQASEKAADIFFLESGHLAVYLRPANGAPIRARTMAHGAIVGEIAYLTGQPRGADVVSEGVAHVLCLRESTLRRIEKKDPDLAALVLSILCRSLAAKLSQSNGRLASAQIATSQGSSTGR